VDRLLVALAVAAVVVAVAAVLQRRGAVAPEPPQGAPAVPGEVDRADFDRPSVPWLVAVFSSRSCETCAGVIERVAPLESDQVAVCEIEVADRPDLHRRYGIDAVPLTLIVDAEGLVRTSFAGPVSVTHLWAAVAEAREPGSTPPGCSGGD
jgi:hypothetical protein